MKKLSKIGLFVLGLVAAQEQSASASCGCTCSDVMEATKATVQVLAFSGEVVGGILRTTGAASGNSAVEAAGGITEAISQSVGAAMTRATDSGRVFTAKGFEAETIRVLAKVAGYHVPDGEPLDRGFRAVFDITADGHGKTELYWKELAGDTPIFEIDFDKVSAILATTSVRTLQRNDYQASEKAQVKAQFDAYRVWAANDIVKKAMVKLLEPLVNTVATYGWSDFTEFGSTKKAYLSLTDGTTDAGATRFATITLPNPPAAPAAS